MRCSYLSTVLCLVVASVLIGCQAEPTDTGTTPDEPNPPTTLRIATMNIEDIRTIDVLRGDQPRMQAAAAIIQSLRPDILLLNELTYDMPGAPDVPTDATPGQNARQFAEQYLAVAQSDALEPIRYATTYMVPTNTGVSSGFDFDNSGQAVTAWEMPPPPNEDGTAGAQTPEGRAYGNDSWGFGTFPGQYAMALFLREGLELQTDAIRTFQMLPWSAMPGALRPEDPATNTYWYDDEEWAAFRLSSKNHWDAPVRLEDGTIIHVLASHPTPPAFDGPENRNKNRNHDEIRFWAEYLNSATWVTDDTGQAGGLADEAAFVIMGDLNADPDEGSSINNPIATHLFAHPRINGSIVPVATDAGQAAFPDLDPDDTASWGLRVDYVLPSMNLNVVGSGVWRPDSADELVVSDHFPVWIDVQVGGDE